MRIIKNPNEEIYREIAGAVAENDGYCPCSLVKSEDTKCICTEFFNSINLGECHCGKYIKVEDKSI